MASAIALRPRDLVRIGVSTESQFLGTDICASLSDLHRIYYLDGLVVHGRNPDRGKASSWEDIPFAIGATNNETIPTITWDQSTNNLFAAFHGTSLGSDLAQLFVSDDLGETWALVDEVVGRKWPRATVVLDTVWVAMYASPNIELYELVDRVLTLRSSFAADPQVPAYSTDFRNRHILLYNSAGGLVQRINEGRVIANPITLAGSTGRNNPVAVYSWLFGRHFFWNTGGTLVTVSTDSTMEKEDSGSDTISASFPEQVIGATVDNFGHFWIIGQLNDSSLQLLNSIDGGRTFLPVT